MYHLGRGAARSDILSSSCLPDLDDGAGLDIPVFLWKGSFLKKRRFWGVLDRFGNQPPHPPIFGKDLPKKVVSLDAFPNVFSVPQAELMSEEEEEEG